MRCSLHGLCGLLIRLLLLSATVAFAAPASSIPAPPSDVRRTLGDGVVVDWTRRRLEVVATRHDNNPARDLRPLEQAAMTAIDARFEAALALVPVRPGYTWATLPDRQQLPSIPWRVAETRYHTGGSVDVVGAVDLRDVLAPWSTARAVPPPAPSLSDATGALIDARGIPVTPCYAPVLQTVSGEVLFDSIVWKDIAWQTTPVVWVADPMHAAARVAGLRPEMFLATGADTCTIGVADADAARWRERVAPVRAVGAGGVVIVVDP